MAYPAHQRASCSLAVTRDRSIYTRLASDTAGCGSEWHAFGAGECTAGGIMGYFSFFFLFILDAKSGWAVAAGSTAAVAAVART
jgi:hypothetical protein